MVKRRTTRTTTKKPGPVVPDAEEEKGVRQEKLKVLINDFNYEMAARYKHMESLLQHSYRQIDVAYSMGIFSLLAPIRAMKITDHLDGQISAGLSVSGADVDNAAGTSTQNAKMAAELASVPQLSELAPPSDVDSLVPATSRKTVRKGRKTKGQALPSTACRTRGSKMLDDQMLVTPGNSSTALSQWTRTPIITPKFDPRSFCTPAVGAGDKGPEARQPKPGELFVSLDGSPVRISNKLVVTNEVLQVPLTGEFSMDSLDSQSLHGVFGVAEKLYETLKAVVNYQAEKP